MKKVILLMTMLAIGIVNLNAQKITLENGNPSVLKGQKKFQIQYEYNDMKVGDMTEKAYIERTVKKKNSKEAGAGDSWKEAWENDKQTRYPKEFEKLFNKYGPKYGGLEVSQTNEDSKYIMVVQTDFIEPGYNAGVSRRPAYVTMKIIYKERESGNKVAVYKIKNSIGSGAMGYDFDTGYRISQAYAKAAKSFVGYLGKKVLK